MRNKTVKLSVTRLTGLAAVSIAVSLFAQDAANGQEGQGVSQQQMQSALQTQNQAFQSQNRELQQQLAELNAKLDAVEAKTNEPAAPAEVKKEEKKYPQIKQSGDVGFTPRMEINGGKDSEGDRIENGINRRRLMLAWNYKLSVAINEKLDLGFWLADPEDGTTIAGSGVNVKDMLTPRVRNASFTWKPASAFNLSGGIINVPSNAALDAATVIEVKDPTKNFANTYFNALAGFKFDFPIASAFKLYAIAGIYDNQFHNKYQVTSEGDTITPYSDGRIVIGAEITLAEKKISLKPAVQIITRGDILNTDGSAVNDERKPLISEGLDMSFKFANAFNLNAMAGLAHDSESDKNKEILFNFGLEPVLNFGGENSKLFNFRFKYAMFVLNDNSDGSKNESAMVNHIDTRFGINVNERFAIVPRYRLWAGNNSKWFEYSAEGSDTKATKSLNRLELGFNASF